MKLVTYKWRYGSRVNADPVASGKALERIRKKKGKITRESVAEAARDKSCPFHLHVWGASDREAAWEFRLVRANEVIRAVVAVVEYVKDKPPVEVPAFPNIGEVVESGKGGGFYTIDDVMNDVGMREQLLNDFLIRMRNLKMVYGNLVELASVWAAVETVTASLSRPRMGKERHREAAT